MLNVYPLSQHISGLPQSGPGPTWWWLVKDAERRVGCKVRPHQLNGQMIKGGLKEKNHDINSYVFRALRFWKQCSHEHSCSPLTPRGWQLAKGRAWFLCCAKFLTRFRYCSWIDCWTEGENLCPWFNIFSKCVAQCWCHHEYLSIYSNARLSALPVGSVRRSHERYATRKSNLLQIQTP